MSLEPKPIDTSAKLAADAKASLLLRKAEDSYAFPVLDSVGNQFARSLRDLVRALGAPTVNVERAPAVQMRFADWCQEVSLGLFWRYHAPPLKGPVLLAATRPLVLQLVDIFYGGKGQLGSEREELTDAEERFAARLKLAQLPRNSAPTRVRNRCELTGRPRAFYRKLKLSRIALRDLASKGIRVCTIAPGLFDTPLLDAIALVERSPTASQVAASAPPGARTGQA